MRGKSPTQQLFFVSLIAKRRLQFKTHNFLLWNDNDDGSPTLKAFGHGIRRKKRCSSVSHLFGHCRSLIVTPHVFCAWTQPSKAREGEGGTTASEHMVFSLINVIFFPGNSKEPSAVFSRIYYRYTIKSLTSMHVS